MAGGMDLGAKKGGKKSLDTPINLVPFIDLMAVTISFLIMTAVWNQVAKLPVTQEGGVLRWDERDREPHRSVLSWHQALIRLRRSRPSLQIFKFGE